MKYSFIVCLLLVLTGCNPADEIMSAWSGYFQDIVLKSMSGGKDEKKVKAEFKKVIDKNVKELEAMNDTEIDEVYKKIDSHLKDGDMSMYDYNSIMAVINQHKRKINNK